MTQLLTAGNHRSEEKEKLKRWVFSWTISEYSQWRRMTQSQWLAKLVHRWFKGRRGKRQMMMARPSKVPIGVANQTSSTSNSCITLYNMSLPLALELVSKWGGHTSCAKRRKKFCCCAHSFFCSTSIISRFGHFRDGHYSLVNFLFAILLTVPLPPCPAVSHGVGVTGHCCIAGFFAQLQIYSVQPSNIVMLEKHYGASWLRINGNNCARWNNTCSDKFAVMLREVKSTLCQYYYLH